MTPSGEGKIKRASKNPKSTRYGRQNPICEEWNGDEQITKWRKALECAVNAALEQRCADARIYCRSFKERGIDEQPTIHEGVATRFMENDAVLERKEINRQICEDNKLLR